jgi:hypothetical protein
MDPLLREEIVSILCGKAKRLRDERQIELAGQLLMQKFPQGMADLCRGRSSVHVRRARLELHQAPPPTPGACLGLRT